MIGTRRAAAISEHPRLSEARLQFNSTQVMLRKSTQMGVAMKYQVLLCGLFFAGCVTSSNAEEVDTCFALWDADAESRITVRGEIVEIGKDFLAVANTVGNDTCELEVYPANKTIPENCKIGGTLLATGIVFFLPDYSDLVDATVSCS